MEAGKFRFSPFLAQEFVQQAILINPFAKTWDELAASCKKLPGSVSVKSSKTLR
jgi:hypothetical protein